MQTGRKGHAFLHFPLHPRPMLVVASRKIRSRWAIPARFRRDVPLDHQNVHALIRNNSDEPITLEEGMISVKVSTVPKDREILPLGEFAQAQETYGKIPQILTSSCHCEIIKHLKPEEEAVKILISDQYGNTSIGNILSTCTSTELQTKKLKQGIHIMDKGTNTTKLTTMDTLTMLLVTDEFNGLGHIQRKDFKRIKRRIEKILSKRKT